MIRNWILQYNTRVCSLNHLIVKLGVQSVEELLEEINAKIPRKLFSNKFEKALYEICKAYWPRICGKFENCECFSPVEYMSVEKFKNDTFEMLQSALWKLHLGVFNQNDESVLQARLITLKEAYRLASKFQEVYIHSDYFGDTVRDMNLENIIPFNTKCEMFDGILLGEDQIWFVKRTGNTNHNWYIYFGDGGIPEEVKIDDGNFYILDDLGEILGKEYLQQIKSLIGKTELKYQKKELKI
jgi:hypothetical protein